MLELDTNEKMKELVNLFLLSANPDIVAMGEDFKRGMMRLRGFSDSRGENGIRS